MLHLVRTMLGGQTLVNTQVFELILLYHMCTVIVQSFNIEVKYIDCIAIITEEINITLIITSQ